MFNNNILNICHYVGPMCECWFLLSFWLIYGCSQQIHVHVRIVLLLMLSNFSLKICFSLFLKFTMRKMTSDYCYFLNK